MDVLALYRNSTVAIRLAGSITSSVCLVVASLLFLLLIFHKAYTSTLQRLLLYLMIFSVIQEACLSVGYATQFEYSEHEAFCDMISIVWQWSTTVSYLLTLAMIVYLPYKIYQQFKGGPFPRLSRSKCCRVALECLFIFIVLVLPLTYILPLAHCGYYLLQSQLCRMSFIDQVTNPFEENCTSIMFSSQVPYYVGGIDFVGMFVVIIALSVVFCCLACKYRETRATLRRTLCQTLILLGFFVVYFIIELGFSFGVSFGVRNDVAKVDSLLELLEVILVVVAVILPLFQLMFPFTFLFYLHSCNLFRWRAIKRAAAEWRCFRSCCGIENTREAATAPASDRVTPPSVTFFNVLHSRITTDVPNEQQALLPDGGDERGHGTIVNS